MAASEENSVENQNPNPNPNPNPDPNPSPDLNPEPASLPLDGASVAVALAASLADAPAVVAENGALPPPADGTEIPVAAVAALPLLPQTEAEMDGPGHGSNGTAADSVNVVVPEAAKKLPVLPEANKKASEVATSEVDSMNVPEHWLVKPSLHVSSIGGKITEEDELLAHMVFEQREKLMSSNSWIVEGREGSVHSKYRLLFGERTQTLKGRGCMDGKIQQSEIMS